MRHSVAVHFDHIRMKDFEYPHTGVAAVRNYNYHHRMVHCGCNSAVAVRAIQISELVKLGDFHAVDNSLRRPDSPDWHAFHNIEPRADPSSLVSLFPL